MTLNFHRWLDALFHKRVTFSVFFRIWFAFACVIALASALAVYQMQKAIKPSAQRVVEDTLVDTSRLLAALLAPSLTRGELQSAAFNAQLAQAMSPPVTSPTRQWFHHKDKSQFHIYVTDAQGKVIYDSQGLALGKDFSRWNDVYLTLRGKYGARATRTDPNNEETSVMYVASPIFDQQSTLIGVVSVGKPVLTLQPYIATSRNEVFKTMLYAAGLGLIFSALMAAWLRHSIQQVNRYTQRLASVTPPHFYLGKELNELVSAIDEMKDTIENKAYVTDYVHTLTHELKSPLTAIRASGELLGDELPVAHREQFSQTILAQSDKLQDLIERMLVLAKIEQPSFKLTLQPQPIATLLDACLVQQQAWLHQKQLACWVVNHEGLPCLLDAFWMRQALQNLLDNAIKFAEHFVIVAVWQDQNDLKLTIINDSAFMPDYVLDKAFERYFSYQSAPSTDTVKQKGTGLGLTLVKQVIELHQGELGMAQCTLGDYLVTQGDTLQGLIHTKLQASLQDAIVARYLDSNCIILTITLPCAR